MPTELRKILKNLFKWKIAEKYDKFEKTGGKYL